MQRFSAVLQKLLLYECERCACYSCGGFNTPDACVVTKGIKADCNHLMRTTYPDARVGGVDLHKTQFTVYVRTEEKIESLEQIK